MRRPLRDDWRRVTTPSSSVPGGTGRDRARRRQTALRFVVVAAVLALVLSLVGPALAQNGAPYTTTDPKSPEGDRIQGLYKLIFAMGVVVFVFVQFLIVYTAMRFKRQRSQTQRPNQIHGHRTLEITWTVIPAIVLLIIAVPTISTIYSTYAAADNTDNAMVVEVYPKQWWWEFHYPGMGPVDASGNATALITANEVRVPEDTKVVFKLYSNNVIHSFWVPEMTGKMDVIPGHERRISFTPQQSGTYYGECAEFCGTAHAWMRFVVKVQPRADFDTWAAAWNAGPSSVSAPFVPNSDITQVPTEFGRCLLCHNINGTQNAVGAKSGIASDPTSVNAGPNLTLLACRDTLAAGLLENTPENLALWLLNPGHVKEGNYMYAVDAGIKNQGEQGALAPEDIGPIVAYLESLRPDAGCPEAGTENGNMNTNALAENAEPVATPMPATPGAAGGATPAPAAGGPVQLEGIDINWTQKELTVPVGGTIDMWNGGVLEHNFAIEGYNDATPVDLPIGGQHVPWTVPADLAPGTYTFYCTVPGHREAGMVGKITITAA
jgi:cytochrome c oxidase subunit 2